MCTHTRLVRNRVTGTLVRVACGKCEACQQKKATLRANRIRNNQMDGFVSLFVTLTYDNIFVPYIRRDELVHGEICHIYRDCSLRWYKDKLIVKNSRSVLDSFLVPEDLDLSGLIDLNGKPDCIGVIFTKDVQDFIKRLRINYLRKYEKQLELSYFCCHEYGGHSYRPHSHLLLYVRQDDEARTRGLISSNWSYDLRNPKRLRIEVARNAASYVASYVNCGSDFPPLLKTDTFRQRCHQSKTFGVGLHCFTLQEILEKTDKRDLSYSRTVVRDGISRLDSFPVPKYVINRYFPIFKGYFRFTDPEIFELLRVPKLYFYGLRRDSRIDFTYKNVRYVINSLYYSSKTSLNDDDYHRFVVRLSHAIDFYKEVTGKNEFDFAIDYIRTWNLYRSSVLKESYFDVNGEPISDWSNFYENINEVKLGLVRAPTINIDSSFQLNPNKRFDIVRKSDNLKEIYHKMSKNKNVVNFALSHQGYSV